MSSNEIEVMKKSIVDAGLYIVEPEDLEKLAEDTLDENNKKMIESIENTSNKKDMLKI